MSETTHRNGGLAVVSTLVAHGVDTIFGIPGTHNLEFYRHLPAFGIRAVTPRHEQGAGYGADGYFLLSGKPGVVITTSGPGLTNVITAAATAYAESRPMLILSPGVPTGLERADIGMLHETKDSSGALSHLLVSSQRTRTAEGAAQAVAEAFALFASSRPGPVHIEVPLDVLEGAWHGSVPAPIPARRPGLDAHAVTRAAEAIRSASRPVIVAGGGARAAAAEVAALAESIDAPVATTANGKGIVDEDHPLSLGSNVRFPSVQAETAAADVLIVLGSELADSDLWGGTIGAQTAPGVRDESADQVVIRCDIDPDQLGKNLSGDILVCADTGEFLTALAAELDAAPAAADTPAEDTTTTDGGTASARERVETIRAHWGADFDSERIGARVTRLVAAGAGPDVVIAGDSSQVTYDGSVHALLAHTPDQLLYMPGFATLGYGIPAAIGAKVASPQRPVVCVLGDGAAMFSIQEVMTATELGLGIPFVIVDNGGYAEIEEQMVDRDMEPFAVRLARPDFAQLGASMGGVGVSMRESEMTAELPDAVAEALGRAVPTIIHITVGD
ncbi:thiamine pyrophosphate-binding protein [Brevibacterium casei]|uniref:Thiamine pyrophosphate protein central region n=1 Tax=Brevibacterium casei S18 TaxID=1229781 RepID=K9AXS8_9MICO|nr:thiamine pyrophosphate-binding protein [Brevibacterium casei]SIJ12703.1 thiamine pyrophosphate-dependent enzyme, possible carboligase or decarboxylase [Mycobacteroides abscessus subsp. abscessus]EKU46320.1 thiamine pyrophosphate protein central region [Brevibacterium casei S18]MCT1550011.1 thiamine pyrophosphate-binding protein [Brevibacterium casei]MCT1561290.1 thiamine pyrophosphate-binding protein [Brevibacterium casei]MCT2183537.1 thiamine pyrophosphate-binding protein [Brevibacterium c